MGLGVSILAHADGPNDEVALRRLVDEQTAAWNRGDARAYSERFSAVGGFTNILGTVFVGREQFERRYAGIFKGMTFRQDLERLYFVRPDIAVLDLHAEMTGYARPPPGVPASPDGVLRHQAPVHSVQGGRRVVGRGLP